jgi:FkbM family methyltransferase
MPLLKSLRFIAAHPLSKGREFQSIWRFVKWQMRSRLVPGVAVHNWVGGSRFLVRAGETGMTGNIYTGLHDFADMGYLLHVLRKTDLFVDMGANVGSYTILASAAVGARSVAFEPSPGTYDRLVENVRINGAQTRVRCLNAGVGRAEGVVKFATGTDTTNHVAATSEGGARMIDVRICTLDAALDGLSPAVAKLDVEGYELPALEGARKTLGKESLHSVIMELNGSGSRYGFDESHMVKMMSDFGFRMYAYDPLNRKLTGLCGNNAEGNTIFVRNLEFVKQRLAAAPMVSIVGKTF